MWKEEGWIHAQAQAARNSVAAGGRYSEGRWDALFTAGHTPANTTRHNATVTSTWGRHAEGTRKSVTAVGR